MHSFPPAVGDEGVDRTLVIADQLAAEFAKSIDAGWAMVNNPTTWVGGIRFEDEVRDELIRRGVLFPCFCGNKDMLFNAPVTECMCHDDEFDTGEDLRDGDYDEEDDTEDPLAGDIDDGRDYVPEPGPLDTPHYFALKERGYI